MRCPYLQNYLCSFADECRIRGPPKFCAYHVLQRKEYSVLLKDARKEGYYLYGIEYIIKQLNEKSYEILYNNTNSKRSSEGLKFFPAKIKTLDDLASDVGASSLGSCPAKIILNKYFEPPKEVKRLLEIGTRMHEIFNKDFGPNYKNQFEFPSFLSRSEYCEIPVMYELEGIKIGGRIDSLLTTKMDCKDIPVIVDLKRSKYGSYERKNYLVQLGIYKLALNSDEALLITIKRSKSGYPKPTINYVDANFDEWLKDYLLEKFSEIGKVLIYGEVKYKKCEECEMKAICKGFDFKKLQSKEPWNKFLKFF